MCIESTSLFWLFFQDFLLFDFYDIMSAKEKQAAAKQTFVFLAPLANEYPAKQDGERVSANS